MYKVNVIFFFFRNFFVIIHYHLPNVSSQIKKNIIFEPNELSITLSTLLSDLGTDNIGKLATYVLTA